MNLRVPNLMMAAVAGLGLFAAYRLIKNKTQDVSPEGSDGSLALLGDPLKLSTNRYYRARLRVHDGGVPPFLSTSTREGLQAALQALGFANVTVYMTASELPSNWPSSTVQNAGPMDRWFQAQWTQPSVSLPRPPDIQSIWIASPPSNANFAATSGEAEDKRLRFSRFTNPFRQTPYTLPPQGGYRIRHVPAEIDWGAPQFNNQVPLDNNGEVAFSPGTSDNYGVEFIPNLPRTLFENLG